MALGFRVAQRYVGDLWMLGMHSGWASKGMDGWSREWELVGLPNAFNFNYRLESAVGASVPNR